MTNSVSQHTTEPIRFYTDEAVYTLDYIKKELTVVFIGPEFQQSDPDRYKYREAYNIKVGEHAVFIMNPVGRVVVTERITAIEGNPLDALQPVDGNVLLVTENSAYEINPAKKLICRRAGINSPTHHTGSDNEWSSYERIANLETGERVLVLLSYWSRGGIVTSPLQCVRGSDEAKATFFGSVE
jgi:hypothetical protein